MMSMIAAVRVRGVPDTSKTVTATLESLHLTNKHNCVLLADTDANRGMLTTAKDYIAYGPVDADTITSLLRERADVDGGNLADAADGLGYDDADDLAAALVDGDLSPRELRDAGVSIPFRLSPPSKGFKDSRRHYNQGGALGERDDMDVLLRRMI
jgi:large subunit ribosomal protein L30